MQQKDLASMIFSPINPLPKALLHPQTRQEVLQQIFTDPDALFQYNNLNPRDREALIDFCMGNRGLKITYDPFFQKIFHPELHPERLNALLSAILKQPVSVKGILSREGVRLTSEASLMVMDIIVELADGSLINVEMQKIGYEFPIERTFCYGADLLVRQYDRIRYNLQKDFQYNAMRPVYVIVLMEESPKLFAQYRDYYIHHSSFQLNSGVPIENLLNFIYISLDIFKEIPHNELTELEAWLYFLGSDNPLHIQQIIEKYPFFKDIYQDIINFRYHPKELITMFSESLRIADQNTVKLMIDDLKQEVQDLEQKSQLLTTKNNSLLTENDSLIAKNESLIAKNNSLITENNSLITENNSLITENNSLITENNSLVIENSKKDAEIARLLSLLEKQK